MLANVLSTKRPFRGSGTLENTVNILLLTEDKNIISTWVNSSQHTREGPNHKALKSLLYEYHAIQEI